MLITKESIFLNAERQMEEQIIQEIANWDEFFVQYEKFHADNLFGFDTDYDPTIFDE